jgi:hypothetical protein
MGKKLVVGKNNQVLLTIGPMLGISAENTRWLMNMRIVWAQPIEITIKKQRYLTLKPHVSITNLILRMIKSKFGCAGSL